MKFLIFFFSQKTPLHIAVEKGIVQIVQTLLQCERIDVNAKCILKNAFF